MEPAILEFCNNNAEIQAIIFGTREEKKEVNYSEILICIVWFFL